MAYEKHKVNIMKHSFSQVDLFDHLKMTQTIGLQHPVTHDKYGCNCYKVFCGKVFAYFLFLVILDIIENNIIFVFPRVKDFYCKFMAEILPKDVINKVHSNGGLREIDLFNTLGKAYKITYLCKIGSIITSKTCYLDRRLRNAFYSKINSGKQYG